MAARICEPTGKRKYTRHQDAAKVMAVAQKKARDGVEVPRSMYQCDQCGRWHLTSYEAEETRQLQQARRRQERERRDHVNRSGRQRLCSAGKVGE